MKFTQAAIEKFKIKAGKAEHIEFDDGMRPHQVRLQGGDASSDSFCFS